MRGRFGRYLRQHHIALLALFVALGGTAYAAVTLPSNSVGTRQIKPKGVKGADIASNAVTSPKVKNGSLLAADFKPGQLAQGLTGDKGADGTNGTNAAKYWARITYSGQTASVAASSGGITTSFVASGLTDVVFPAAVEVSGCAFAITLDTAAVNGVARKSANGSSGSTVRVSATDFEDNFLNASFDIVGFC